MINVLYIIYWFNKTLNKNSPIIPTLKYVSKMFKILIYVYTT